MSSFGTDLLQITVERTGTTVRIAAAGEIDISTADRLREQIGVELATDSEIVMIDLSDVNFIDSSGLHAVLDAAMRAPQRIRVIPGAASLTLFMISGVTEHLPLVDYHDHDGLRPHPLGKLSSREPGPGY